MTAVELALQGLSLLLNLFVTKSLGTEAVGITSLVLTFYGTTVTLSNGNIFLCSTRCISEEFGKHNGNPNKIFKYSVIFSLTASIIFSALIYYFSIPAGNYFFNDKNSYVSIRIIALTLPMTALSSCIKGWFNSSRKITFLLISDSMDFLVRSGSLVFLIMFLVESGKLTLISAIALSILIGESISLIFLTVSYFFAAKSCENPASISFRKYILISVPIILNSCIPIMLSSCNEALLPLTLRQCGNSTSQALSLYGMFEAIIIPALFFPSAVLCSLSSILVPEISRLKTENNFNKIATLSEKALSRTMYFSVFVSGVFLIYGKEIGILLDGDAFSGKIISVLAFVVPFIYLEIILESILKGLGKHGFSSFNYIAEYIVRISVLLICVPIMDFYGVVVSYYASNIVGNIARIFMLSKCTGVKFSPSKYVVLPVVSAFLSYQPAILISRFTNLDILLKITLFILVSAIFYVLLLKFSESFAKGCGSADKKFC